MRHDHTIAAKEQPITIHLISHNHWDREWIFTATYANRWLPVFFDNLLKMLESQPAYRFVLDGQMLIIEDYLKQLSADEAALRERDIRRYVQNGQLLIGPAYLQPDWSLVSGESLVRNLLIGDKMARRYGRAMKAGWLLDNFGQIAQAPQIFRGFGIEGAFVWRGVEMPPEALRTEFHWEAPDGSRILGIYLLDSYRNAMVLAMTRDIARQRVLAHTETLRRFAATPNVLLMNGYEQVPEPDDVLPIIEDINRDIAAAQVRQSTPEEYLAAVNAANPALPVVGGYLYSGRYAPILKGVYSSRSRLNQMNNDCQRELERWAEKFNTFAWAFGFDYPEQRFEQAWKTLLLNHTHDDLCGCCIDPIAQDMEARFIEVSRAARTMSSESLCALAQAADTSRVDGAAAVLVFNPSSRTRREVVGVALDIPESMEAFTLLDCHGRLLPYQLVSRIGRKAALYFWADAVPAVGYKTVYLLEGRTEEEAVDHPTVRASAEERIMENDRLRVVINEDGTLTIHDKTRQTTYPGLGYFEDGGDCGDTYDYSFPPEDRIITSRGGKADVRLDQAGPLLAVFRVEITLDLPRELAPDRKSRSDETTPYRIVSYVELAANSAHVGVHTCLTNNVKDHRLRVLFPTGIETDCSLSGAPFDVARFPIGGDSASADVPPELGGLMLAGRYIEPVNTHPFQNFVTLSDDRRSLHIFSRGLNEFEILPQESAIALTLLRGVGWLARADLPTRIGDVGPHIMTPQAQSLVNYVFDYAVYPHGGDLRSANPQFESDRQTLRFRAVQTDRHTGRLPDEFSFLSWVEEQPEGALKLTALKKAEDGDGVIIRFYNSLEQEAVGRLRIGAQLLRAWKTNLNEENLSELQLDNGGIRFQARGKEIVTIRVRISPGKLLDDFELKPAQVLFGLEPSEAMESPAMPPVIDEREVAQEEARAEALAEALQVIRSRAYEMGEEVARQSEPAIESLTKLQRLKGQEATLARQYYEARISALLNRQLLVDQEIRQELGTIGESLNWARVRKRVGEFLIHYYESQNEKPSRSEE